MSIFHIAQFQARPGREVALFEALAALDGVFGRADGCQSRQVLQALEEPHQVVVIEEWDSVAHYRAAMPKTPVHLYETVMQLLIDPPTSAFYRR